MAHGKAGAAQGTKEVSLIAPEGKFRVIGEHTFNGDVWLENDFDTIDGAVGHADRATRGTQMLKMSVYDDVGTHRHHAGH